ncbi:MAG: hypothetical protein PUK70_06445 [Bacteroidales bacterium]|nr:hypothetical protein [Bacteroidales bacterium]MDY6001291.1 hypothetical protein [Candidatus Cryptobacteroides sp.]
MTNANYSVNQYLVSNILNMIQVGEIAIPEIQRSFLGTKEEETELIGS